MNGATLVQPIVLLVDKAEPAAHTDAVHAAALASVLAYAQEIETSGAAPVWDEWLAGPFTKTVRRADAKTFAKLAEKFDGVDHAAVTYGQARALAFQPVTYDGMSRALAKLQVSGTELPERASDSAPAPEDVPAVVLNAGLGMSTGKCAAQAGHALFAWYLTLGEAGRLEWYEDGCPFQVRFLDADDFAEVAATVTEERLIVDAGRTEIAPDTATAFVLG